MPSGNEKHCVAIGIRSKMLFTSKQSTNRRLDAQLGRTAQSTKIDMSFYVRLLCGTLEFLARLGTKAWRTSVIQRIYSESVGHSTQSNENGGRVEI